MEQDTAAADASSNMASDSKNIQLTQQKETSMEGKEQPDAD